MDNQLHISVIDPINPAIDRVKDLLFRPIDLRKWFIIGFCAFLANLGHPGFINASGRGGPGGSPAEGFSRAKDYLNENFYWIIPLTIVLLIFFIALYVLILWLSSRGKFMFLYCVAENTAEVKRPWNKYKKQANSLFLFRLVLVLTGAVCIGLTMTPIALSAITLSRRGSSMAAGILAIVLFGLLATAVIIVFALIGKFTRDFVVPVMYLRGCRAVEGWRIFMPLLKAHAGSFTCYILFYILIAMAIAFMLYWAVCIACICTFCIAGCLVSLPYIGTVILLPIYVFTRSYSLYYLSQFGPGWDVFAVPQVVPLQAV